MLALVYVIAWADCVFTNTIANYPVIGRSDLKSVLSGDAYYQLDKVVNLRTQKSWKVTGRVLIWDARHNKPLAAWLPGNEGACDTVTLYDADGKPWYIKNTAYGSLFRTRWYCDSHRRFFLHEITDQQYDDDITSMVAVYDTEPRSVKHMFIPKYTAAPADGEGGFWVYTGKGLAVWSALTNTMTDMVPIEPSVVRSGHRKFGISPDGRKAVIMREKRGLPFHLVGRGFDVIDIKTNHRKTIWISSFGVWWDTFKVGFVDNDHLYVNAYSTDYLVRIRDNKVWCISDYPFKLLPAIYHE